MNSSEAATIASPSPDQDLDIERILNEVDRERINPNDFRGDPHFTDEEISRDLESCAALHDIFEKQQASYDEARRASYERGLKAEFVFRHAIEQYGWLAENLKLIVTSQYDDYVKGIDTVAQIETGDGEFEHIGLAIDFATDADGVGEKLAATFDSLDLGYTPSVKYFKSEKTGQLRNFKVPRIVIGGSGPALERLSAYSSEIMNGSAIASSVQEEIRKDPFRLTLFGEIISQLSVFINRLKKVIDFARSSKDLELERRCASSISIHIKSLATIQKLMTEAEIDFTQIQKQIRGDAFAVKMANGLSKLSLTPIKSGSSKNRQENR